MKELVVLSGKGGTGKTSVLASLAVLARPLVVADCDVDAANLHLVLDPHLQRCTPFVAGHVARIRPQDCRLCGDCERACRFSAIEITEGDDGRPVYRVDPTHCEGCGVCLEVCPEDAIDFPCRRCGQWHVSTTRVGTFVDARLDVGAENSGRLVHRVRQEARRLAEEEKRDLVLLDGPPGIGCPASAALTGADLALMITEPSLSGLHDLERVLDLAARFAVPAVVAINRFDLDESLSERITGHCAQRGLPVLARIPFEPRTSDAQRTQRSLIELCPSCEASREIHRLWRRLEPSLRPVPVGSRAEGRPLASLRCL